MDKRKWRTPNELVTLKRAKKPRRTDEIRQESTADFQPVLSSPPFMKSDVEPKENVHDSAMDWCLKLKIRIVSRQDFSWLDKSKAYHETKALASSSLISKSVFKDMDDMLVAFHQSLIVWSHPFLPYLDLFPRMEVKFNAEHYSPAVPTEREASLLKDHWSASFHSVYQLLCAGHCPYFYVCANSVTILLLSREIMKPHGLALLSPTTLGFQEAMRKQGVHFSLPLVDRVSEGEQEEDANDWLKSMVDLDAQIFIQAGRSKSPANSLVVVNGAEFNGFINFILNTKSLISSDGRFARIPPTILAPKPFLGATTSALKVKRSQIMEAETDGQLTERHYIDVEGPIMPDGMRTLKAILESMQQHVIQYHHCEETSSFNLYFKSVGNQF